MRKLAFFVVLGLLAALPGRSAMPAHGAVLVAPNTTSSGTVTSVAPDALGIRTAKGKTKTFRIDSSTTIEKLGDHASAADLHVGQPVKVDFSAAADGTLTATGIAIGVTTPSGTFYSTKTTGSITATAAGSLRIDHKGTAVEFHLAPGTSYKRLAVTLEPSDLKTGDLVKVKFAIAGDGTLTASSVAVGVTTSIGLLYNDTLDGAVKAVASGSLSIEGGNGQTLSVPVAPTTRFERLNTPINAAGVQPGDTVEIGLTVAPDGSVVAASVSVGVPTAALGIVYSSKLSGTVASVSSSTLTLLTKDGTRVAIDLSPKTSFKRNALPAKRSVVRRGSAAKVRFSVGPAGSLHAVSVTIGTVRGGKLVFPKKTKGTLRHVSAASLTLAVGGGKLLVFRLSSSTAYERAGRRTTRSALKAGAAVKIKYLPAGTARVALLVQAKR